MDAARFSHPRLPLLAFARSAGGSHSQRAVRCVWVRIPLAIVAHRNGYKVASWRRGSQMSSAGGCRKSSSATWADCRRCAGTVGKIPHRCGPMRSARLHTSVRTALPRAALSRGELCASSWLREVSNDVNALCFTSWASVDCEPELREYKTFAASILVEGVYSNDKHCKMLGASRASESFASRFPIILFFNILR